MVYDPTYGVTQGDGVEIDQQPEPFVGKAKVSKQLGAMDLGKLLDGFDFHDD